MGRCFIVSGIYIIENCIDGKVYIGQSVDIASRLCCHISMLKNSKHHNLHLQRAYIKCGGIIITDILEICDVSELDEREIYWINYYDSTNPKYGYNIASGGLSNREYTQTEALKSKLSKLAKDRFEAMSFDEKHEFFKYSRSKRVYHPLTDAQKEKIRIANSGKNNFSYGKHLGDDTKLKIKNAIHCAHLNGAYRQEKPVYCLDRTYGVVKEFPSISVAAKFVGRSIGNVSAALTGTLCTSAGYFWAYKDEYDKNPIEYMNVHRRQSRQSYQVIKYDMEMNRIESFDSVFILANKLDIDPSHLCRLFKFNGNILFRNNYIFIREKW